MRKRRPVPGSPFLLLGGGPNRTDAAHSKERLNIIAQISDPSRAQSDERQTTRVRQLAHSDQGVAGKARCRAYEAFSQHGSAVEGGHSRFWHVPFLKVSLGRTK